MKVFYIVLFAIVACISSCKSESEDYTDENAMKLWQYLNDSTFILSGLKELEIHDSILGFNYYSISKESFLEAFKRNYTTIRLFDKKTYLNEYLEKDLAIRTGKTLRIKTKNGFKDFKNIKEDSLNREKKFFHYNVIGDYHLIKKFHFEDAMTLILNAKTDSIELILPTLNVFYSNEDSLLYVSDSRLTVIGNKTLNHFIRLDNNRLDTIASFATNWFTNFAFFDKSNKSMYFILEIYDQNEISSCFAKMEIHPVIK